MLPLKLWGTELESHPCKENPVHGDAFLSWQCQGSKDGQIPMAGRTSEPGVARKLQANERPAVKADSTRGMIPRLTSSLHLHVLVSTHLPVYLPFAYAHKHILMWTHMYLFTLLHSTRKKINWISLSISWKAAANYFMSFLFEKMKTCWWF